MLYDRVRVSTKQHTSHQRHAPDTYTMADSDDRIEVASAFVLQSPPGEINDVLNGSRSHTLLDLLRILMQTLRT